MFRRREPIISIEVPSTAPQMSVVLHLYKGGKVKWNAAGGGQGFSGYQLIPGDLKRDRVPGQKVVYWGDLIGLLGSTWEEAKSRRLGL